jgi:hypothetical protein
MTLFRKKSFFWICSMIILYNHLDISLSNMFSFFRNRTSLKPKYLTPRIDYKHDQNRNFNSPGQHLDELAISSRESCGQICSEITVFQGIKQSKYLRKVFFEYPLTLYGNCICWVCQISMPRCPSRTPSQQRKKKLVLRWIVCQGFLESYVYFG